MEYKYALRYSLNIEDKEEGYVKADAIDSKGLADGLVAISILMPPDGSYSQCIVEAINGREKRKMDPEEIFKAWLLLGISLDEEKKLGGWQAGLVRVHTMTVRDIITGNKNEISREVSQERKH